MHRVHLPTPVSALDVTKNITLYYTSISPVPETGVERRNKVEVLLARHLQHPPEETRTTT